MSLTVRHLYESFDQHPDFQSARIIEDWTTRFVLVGANDLPIEVAFNNGLPPLDNYSLPQGYSITSLPPSPGNLTEQRVIYDAPGNDRTVWAAQSVQPKAEGKVRTSTFETYRLNRAQIDSDLRTMLLGARLVLRKQGIELQAHRHTASTTVPQLKELGARAAATSIATIDRAYLSQVSSRR